MMKNQVLILVFVFAVLLGKLAYASDSHDHKESDKKEPGHAEEKDEHGHGEEGHKEHEGHDEEGHEEEGGSAVGPDKGITEKAEAGFKLSTEAVKTIGLQTKAFSGGPVTIPADAIVSIKTEKTVFRLRGGWYKRVDIEVTGKNSQNIAVKSSDFREGDHIVIAGTGFLRIAEVFAEEGASHSHAH